MVRGRRCGKREGASEEQRGQHSCARCEARRDSVPTSTDMNATEGKQARQGHMRLATPFQGSKGCRGSGQKEGRPKGTIRKEGGWAAPMEVSGRAARALRASKRRGSALRSVRQGGGRASRAEREKAPSKRREGQGEGHRKRQLFALALLCSKVAADHTPRSFTKAQWAAMQC